jgi:hypothetical protein
MYEGCCFTSGKSTVVPGELGDDRTAPGVNCYIAFACIRIQTILGFNLYLCPESHRSAAHLCSTNRRQLAPHTIFIRSTSSLRSLIPTGLVFHSSIPHSANPLRLAASPPIAVTATILAFLTNAFLRSKSLISVAAANPSLRGILISSRTRSGRKVWNR